MLLGCFFALLACFVWGAIFVVPEYLSDFTGLEIALGRYLVYGSLSLLFFLLRGDPLWRARAIVGETIIDAIRVNFASVEPLIQEAMATLETGDDEGARMRATLVAGVGKQLRGDPEAYDLLEAAHSADSPQYDAWTAAFAARYLADKPGLDAIALLTESYRQFMELGDSWNAAFSMYYLSGWYLSVERYQESEEAARVARDMADAVGDVIWSAHATRNLGIAALQKGHLVEARTYIDEALARLGAIGDDACIATLSRGLATIALKDGEWMKSLGLMTKAIRSSLRLGSPISAGVTLWHAARLAASAEDGVEAARLAAVAERTLGTKIELLGAPLIREIESMDDQINEIVLPSQRHDIADAVADFSFDAALNEALNWCLARLDAARASA